MKLIGLTGGSGAGKGYVCAEFLRQGIPSIDCDQIARAVCEAHSPCLQELTDTFGTQILLEDGSLHRRKLAEIAFPDPEKCAKLNQITHKYILQACEAAILKAKNAGIPVLILDAPTLFQSGLYQRCDFLIGVLAEYKIRLLRIIERDRLSEKAARERLDAQLPDAYYMAHCNAIIQNNGTAGEESVALQVQKIIRDLGIPGIGKQ
ncbi:MAG TPA: dephospho-CoA kinase [Treponema sp.]|nr:dephospho-CoA kinase [Treponema sp.]